MDLKKIGMFLKELRKQKGITQEEFAEHLNVSSRSVSRWETGNNMPDISLLVDIADFYGVDVREIIEGERKSGMNEEVREVADKMADYAGEEKGRLFKWVRVISLIGTVLLTLAVVFQCINYEANILRSGAIALSFLGLIAFAITTLYANGVLGKLVKKKAFTIAVRVAVLVLVLISVRFIIMVTFVVGLAAYDSAKPFEKITGIENYNKEFLLDQYGSDLDSGMFIFPDDTSNAITSEYESAFKTGMFGSDGRIFLTATYSPDDFVKEVERLSCITCTVFATKWEDSDYHVSDILYDTDTYNYPAYVAVDGFKSVYEYALIDDDNNRIIYVLLSYPDIANDAGLTAYMDYLKKDKDAYKRKEGSSLNCFSVYTFRFVEGVWSGYSPEDEGREPKGNLR